MKAAVWYGKNDLRVENVEEPVIQPGKVKVKVAFAGICGSDLHAYHGADVIQQGTPHPVTGVMAPLTMGHEFSGVITEVGEGVDNVSVGDRVAIEPLIYCGECEHCKNNNYNLCDNSGFIGLHDNGGFAEYVTVEPHFVHKLPDNLSLEQGALIEPAAVAFHAVKQSNMKIGNKVAVFGVGPIGLLTIIAAQAAGASEIYAIDVSSERLQKAKEVGATRTINAMEEDAIKTILSQAPGGVDVAYEVAGVEATLANALSVIRKQGEVMVVSIIPEPIKIDMMQLTLKEAYLTSVLGYRHIYPEVISLVAAGKLDIEKVVTKKIKLENIVEDGMELLTHDKSQAKILIDIQKS
ncbi:2,3-butanediol dehydrogenase [Pontibacillus litoralis]|uniref:Butanediol dehydrogenase n=1 Tax=Pontibacillus litoralis JSM 072002 TaxID=1385512 RepID=A0A0A5G5M4_9BACI|nr:2,3-butanediol dehydrogenase [Pontibacillus litoralis]KGX87359.1 butanediol dehydrogenase [Pontibacillus litoralis JSM 072002]